MMDATRRWLRRNRTTIGFGVGVIGIGYIAGQYVISKISEARERMAGDRIAKENLRRRFQHNQEDCTLTVLELLPTLTENILEAQPAEKIAEELKQKKAQRLGRSVRTSEVAPSDLSSGAPSVTDEDGKSLSSESYVHASQMASSSSGVGNSRTPRSKSQLWNELKISSITRAFTLLYTLCLLSLLTRIQLNLLGRRNYLSSVVSLASHASKDPTISLENREDDNIEQTYGNDFETNRNYLTFSWWLLHKGWREIMMSVEMAVKEVFGSLNPREDVSLHGMSGMILDVRKKFEGSTPEERKTRQWLSFVLPPHDQEDNVLRDSGMGTSTSEHSQQSPNLQDPTSIPSPPASLAPVSSVTQPLRRLLDETSDIVESPMFSHVLTLLLDATFSQLADQKLRAHAYNLPPVSSELHPSTRVMDITDADPSTATAKLATIMAVITKEAHKIGNGVPNEYVQAMESVTELEGFAAVVYSSNFEFESGFQATVNPDTAGSGNGNDRPETIIQKGTSATDDAEPVTAEKGDGIVEKATGVIGAAWAGCESVWGRVMGRAGDG